MNTLNATGTQLENNRPITLQCSKDGIQVAWGGSSNAAMAPLSRSFFDMIELFKFILSAGTCVCFVVLIIKYGWLALVLAGTISLLAFISGILAAETTRDE